MKQISYQDWFNICKSINVIHYTIRIKHKNHMIISTDVERGFWQNPASLYDKNPQNNWHRIIKVLPQIIKFIYDKPTVNIILNGEKLKAFSWELEQDKDAHFYHFYSTVQKVLVRAITQEKEIQGIQISKEEVKCRCLLMIWLYTYRTLKTHPKRS